MRNPILYVLLLAVPVAADDLRKHMPKDQAEAVDAMAAVEELFKQARESTGLKKQELMAQAHKDRDKLLVKLSRDMQKNGMKGWAFKARVGEAGISGDAGDFILSIAYDGMSEATRKVVRELVTGDVFTVTVSPTPGLTFVRPGRNDPIAKINGKAVKAIERKD